MEAFFVSLVVVTLGELGDKTQLLALLLAMRFRKPGIIVAGIVVATLVNHALAGLVGVWIARHLQPVTLRWVVGASFLAIAAWALVPDKLDEHEAVPRGRMGVFAITTIAFFVAEIGDKTQLATVALAARFGDLATVVSGTTLGMIVADVPAVLVAGRFADRIPLKAARIAAATIFAAMGIATLAGMTI